MMRAKFTGGMTSRLPHLINVISQNNPNQTGLPFRCFVQAVNQKKALIDRVTIIDSSYLARHYEIPDKPTRDANWRLDNDDSLKQLEVDWALLDWTQVLHHDHYAQAFQAVQSTYANDAEFQAIADQLAEYYQYKANLTAAKNYLLEECAGALVLVQTSQDQPEATLTYPGKLNDAIVYTLQKHLPDNHTRVPMFVRYKFKTSRQKKLIQRVCPTESGVSH